MICRLFVRFFPKTNVFCCWKLFFQILTFFHQFMQKLCFPFLSFVLVLQTILHNFPRNNISNQMEQRQIFMLFSINKKGLVFDGLLCQLSEESSKILKNCQSKFFFSGNLNLEGSSPQHNVYDWTLHLSKTLMFLFRTHQKQYIWHLTKFNDFYLGYYARKGIPIFSFLGWYAPL